ncbi:hypothetical protein J2D73_17405 [Acetobacter sacchari]|uniref:Uncharacterized protein n=1 Tax=Acetobacter sacchari TaxID=2661687 RepID=A0ABS3M0A3_9PROT|nr:hypothetical protein [Acetobacter sacchari]MBO1361565.1 hypothetical protein [Acetobacter sacchari]
MTNECRPPDGTAGGTYHWLRRKERSPLVAEWNDGVWWFCGSEIDSETDKAYMIGVRYIAPCQPPENVDE